MFVNIKLRVVMISFIILFGLSIGLSLGLWGSYYSVMPPEDAVNYFPEPRLGIVEYNCSGEPNYIVEIGKLPESLNAPILHTQTDQEDTLMAIFGIVYRFQVNGNGYMMFHVTHTFPPDGDKP